MRVLSAMSGGVDSAVATARLVAAGHQVEGVFLLLGATLRSGDAADALAAADTEAEDASRIAQALNIPFTVEDFTERFVADVVTYFLAEYAVGRTPNPCVRCNERIKFGALVEHAYGLGFDAIATGHYARLIPTAPGTPPALHRAVDSTKDQSYVLSVLTPEQLSAVLLPLGGSTKLQVRAESAERGLPVAEKKDSLDICFIPGLGIRRWLADQLGEKPGEIVDIDGTPLGKHDGCYGYTIGQRRGLNLSVPAADGQRRYVLQVQPSTGTVVVGPGSALAVDSITGEGARWCGPIPEEGSRVGVQIRAHSDEVPGILESRGDDGTLRVRLVNSLFGVAPGQTLALYEGTRVIGSATIG